MLGQGVRFVIAGGSVTLIYITTTTVLADVFRATFQLALGIGFGAAILTHFALQRFFVWVHHEEFALPIRAQVARYALVSGTQYDTTVAATYTLPSALHIPATIVYLA